MLHQHLVVTQRDVNKVQAASSHQVSPQMEASLIWHIKDTLLADPPWHCCRFRDNYTVTAPPHIRFYCAAPLVSSNGERLGTL